MLNNVYKRKTKKSSHNKEFNGKIGAFRFFFVSLQQKTKDHWKWTTK